MANFRIRPADPRRDWRALRLLLPEAVHYSCGCDAFVATCDDASLQVVGAVAIAPRMRLAPLPGPKTAFHVIEPWRRRGVARALRDTAAKTAAARGAKALYSDGSFAPHSDAAAAWRALGFERLVNCTLNRIDAQRTVEMLRALFERLQQRGQIPDDARIVPMDEASSEKIMALLTAHLGGAEDYAILRNRLRGKHPAPLDPVLSRVLLLGEQVVGAMLGLPVSSDSVWVEANVVHPSIRGGWANVWLKLDAASRALDRGFRTFLYETREAHADTAKLTSRLAGEVQPRVELYHVIHTTHR